MLVATCDDWRQGWTTLFETILRNFLATFGIEGVIECGNIVKEMVALKIQSHWTQLNIKKLGRYMNKLFYSTIKRPIFEANDVASFH